MGGVGIKWSSKGPGRLELHLIRFFFKKGTFRQAHHGNVDAIARDSEMCTDLAAPLIPAGPVISPAGDETAEEGLPPPTNHLPTRAKLQRGYNHKSSVFVRLITISRPFQILPPPPRQRSAWE